MKTIGVVYGLPVLGSPSCGLSLPARSRSGPPGEHLPFSLTWWSFTFPVGTCVTGTTALAFATSSTLLRITAAALFTGLVAAWLNVALRTAQGVAGGHLFLPVPGSTERLEQRDHDSTLAEV